MPGVTLAFQSFDAAWRCAFDMPFARLYGHISTIWAHNAASGLICFSEYFATLAFILLEALLAYTRLISIFMPELHLVAAVSRMKMLTMRAGQHIARILARILFARFSMSRPRFGHASRRWMLPLRHASCLLPLFRAGRCHDFGHAAHGRGNRARMY